MIERVSEWRDRLSAALNVLRGNPTMYRFPKLVLAEPIKVQAGARLWLGRNVEVDVTKVSPDEALIKTEVATATLGAITCTVTRYSVDGDQLVETTAPEQTSYRVANDYLYLGNSQASASLGFLRMIAHEGSGWFAQYGTAPVLVDGRWGGRNYPRILVGPEELKRVLLEQEQWTGDQTTGETT